MNPAQYLLTVSMIIAAQAPMRQLHAAPVSASPTALADAALMSNKHRALGATDFHPGATDCQLPGR